MPKIAVDLHAHERGGSHDSLTSARQMHNAFAAAVDKAAVVGYVGHDQLAADDSVSGVSLAGIEHTVSESSPEVHIVEYPDYDFKFLAHPQRIDPDDTKQTAKAYINEFGLDGVEKYRSGYKQYDGSIDGVVELAGTDAHNVHGYPTSHMVVHTDSVDAESVIDAVKAGRVELVSVGEVSKWHKVGKGVAMISAGTV